MNFASLNTALLQRACNPPQKPHLARASPSPFKHQAARFLKSICFSQIKIILMEICYSSCTYTLLAARPLPSLGCLDLVNQTGHLLMRPVASTVQLRSHFDLCSDIHRRWREIPWPWHLPRPGVLCAVTKADVKAS